MVEIRYDDSNYGSFIKGVFDNYERVKDKNWIIDIHSIIQKKDSVFVNVSLPVGPPFFFVELFRQDLESENPGHIWKKNIECQIDNYLLLPSGPS